MQLLRLVQCYGVKLGLTLEERARGDRQPPPREAESPSPSARTGKVLPLQKEHLC